ncbi:MAG: dehydrogenase [Gemmatimonadetes bacterium]|nr:dehydrogenase [Gemmatimonadota bacterium]
MRALSLLLDGVVTQRFRTALLLALVVSCRSNPAPATPVPPPLNTVVSGAPTRVDTTKRTTTDPSKVIVATENAALPKGSDVAPVYTPGEELSRVRMADCYRLELVAAEPLVQDPVAIDFDADGRMYVVEMRAYMPNVQGTGESRPIGRIVVVEDTDHDGRMDRTTVFLDSLVLPRAIKVTEHGVLVGAPPNLWLVKDTNGDLVADTKELIRSDYGDPKGNPEHNANGLLWGIDNWIHNANYAGQFRMGADGKVVFRKAPDEGQWGVSSDDYGRLYRNSNEDPLRADLIPSHYALRNPNVVNPKGVYQQLTPNVAVWPAHKTPAINRGYRAETMRPDSSLAHYTSAGSPTAYVGDRLPAELKGSVFITESAGNMVGRLIVNDSSDGMPGAHTAYERSEFLTATDERFRPVNIANAPDGTLYVVDMYRGIIQHRTFITGYLEQKIIERGLEQPIGLGRIWRVVHTSTVKDDQPQLSKKTPAQLVPYLAHPNGWWRITAQRLLVERGDTSVAAALRQMARSHSDDRARLHALWTLDGLERVDFVMIDAVLGDRSAPVRAAAIRIVEPLLARGDTMAKALVMRLIGDRSPVVRRQLAASLGELPVAERDVALAMVIEHSGDDLVVADLVAGAVRGREVAYLESLLSSTATDATHAAPVVRSLARTVVSSRDGASVARVLTLAGQPARVKWQRLALLEGVRRPGGQQGGTLAELPSAPSGLLSAMTSADSAIRTQATQAAASFNWPGKKSVARVVRPLTPTEQRRFAAGQVQYAATCAGCHQALGTGLAGVAKPLVGSPWVLGIPERLIRIVLHGKEGTMLMPPVGATLNNDQIAAVLTYIRRSWGNNASAIEPTAVQEVRGATIGRNKPWTEEELQRIRR